MKIFIDSADINEIREIHSLGLLDGVTTNPTLIAKVKRPMLEVVQEICEFVSGPVSVEAISTKSEDIVQEARKLSKIHPNVVVKVPITSEGLKAVKVASKEGIRINMTLVFSPSQALLAAKAGASYISPFVGRVDDISSVGIDVIEPILRIFENYQFKTELIVASIRNPLHVVEAALLGAPIATVPYKVIKQLLNHPLTDIGIKRFQEDWQKIPKM